MPLTVAIVGRPNVGKSTLFNRLAGKKLAIVHDTPGVTRDLQEAEGQLDSLSLRLLDTAGFDEAPPGTLTARMLDRTKDAIAAADVCLFLIDGRAGLTTGDEIIADALRRSGKPVILAANKCETSRTTDIADSFRLGFGEPVTISAEHGLGLGELYDALAPLAASRPNDQSADLEGDAEKPLKLAIVGRPNVGKSSLFNRLIGEERSLTGPEPGITRDTIAAAWVIGGRTVLLHDTAGLRKRARIQGETIEKLAVGSTLNAVRFAECVVLVIDATAPFEKQDLTIADLAAREGRAVVYAVNKWDLIDNPAGAIGKLRRLADELLPQIAGSPLVVVSALSGEGLDRLLPAVLEADRAWNTHIPTAELNRFLARALERHPPPAIHGRRVRVRYMTQPKTRPPAFVLFGTQLKELPESYLRYIQNELRAAFNIGGTPIRFSLRTASNPYANR
ncbi:MAG: ribosome biogenesis GTPase Der [Rhizomicrobium sp.]|jgi:GTP-binding protein